MNTLKKSFLIFLIAVLSVCAGVFAYFAFGTANIAHADEQISDIPEDNYEIVVLPVKTLSYTGGQQLVAPTSYYTVEQTDGDDYTERGEHTVKLVSTDPDLYRFETAEGETVSEIEFTYNIAFQNETLNFMFSGWEWKGFEISKLPVWTTAYKDTSDPDFYSYYLVAGDEQKTVYELAQFNDAPVGSYTLVCTAKGFDEDDAEATQDYSYTKLTYEYHFSISKATNGWAVAPNVEGWISGKYDIKTNAIAAEAIFGETHVRIVSADDGETVVYDDALGINKLSSASAGSYIMTATVADDANGNFNGISTFVQFRIFEKSGLPWWVTLIIVAAVLGVAALILYILHQKGTLQLLSGKIIVAMRTKATVDATIAAIRANKVAAEAQKRAENLNNQAVTTESDTADNNQE